MELKVRDGIDSDVAMCECALSHSDGRVMDEGAKER
jgi:hypothetical protein